MPHVETFDLELDRAHRRMDDVERRVQQLRQNPAPTVPQYDLAGGASATTPWLVDYYTGTKLAPYLDFGDDPNGGYNVELHVGLTTDGTNDLFEWYINGDLVATLHNDFISSSNLVEIDFGWVSPAFDTEQAGVGYLIGALKIGTSRGASDIWNDPLTTGAPTAPPYDHVFNRTDGAGHYTFDASGVLGNILSVTKIGPPNLSYATIGEIHALSTHSDWWISFYWTSFMSTESDITSITTEPFLVFRGKQGSFGTGVPGTFGILYL